MVNPSTRFGVHAELEDGLTLRSARPEDTDALVEFNTETFDERVTDWTRDLLSGHHPTVQPADFTVVEDTHGHRIVSSLCLISQAWAYDGVPFQAGRFELVATDPAYRRRGLIRKQFDVIHERSLAKGELLQVITGVDWFYRQFGYEMGIKMWGSRCVDASRLRQLKSPGPEACRLRPAVNSDYDFIRDTYQQTAGTERFAALRSPKEWAYEFEGRSHGNTRRREWLVVETNAGERCGYVQYLPVLASPSWPLFRIYQIELRPGVGYLNVAADLLRALWAKAQAMFASGAFSCPELRGLELALERDHLFFRAVPSPLFEEVKPGPWYIRIPDMVAFLRKIRPALERHLDGTVAEAYSGDLRLNLFRSGIFLRFESGRLTAVDKWLPNDISEGDVRLPAHAFQHLVCGWRRLAECADSYPETRATEEAAVLLDCLFPAHRGKVWVLA